MLTSVQFFSFAISIHHPKMFCYEKDMSVCHSIAIGALEFLH